MGPTAKNITYGKNNGVWSLVADWRCARWLPGGMKVTALTAMQAMTTLRSQCSQLESSHGHPDDSQPG